MITVILAILALWFVLLHVSLVLKDIRDRLDELIKWQKVMIEVLEEKRC
jgi:hypothetical protein